MVKGGKTMTKRKVNKRVRGKGEPALVRQKKGSGRGKGQKAIKYPFDQLEKKQSFTIENAQEMEGKVTRRENARVLAYEFGLRHGMRFKVGPIEGTQCTVTRIK